jgi:hypothetical protein
MHCVLDQIQLLEDYSTKRYRRRMFFAARRNGFALFKNLSAQRTHFLKWATPTGLSEAK